MGPVLLCLLVFCSIAVMTSHAECQQGVNCYLPNCFCSTFNHPMNRTEIPQMVYFGFDDAVHIEAITHYDYLFLANHTNPNGCNISITLFVSDDYTQYDVVKEYYERGYELAVHSVTHDHITRGDQVRQEADGQRHNLITKAGVMKEEVVGWRSPFLTTAGDPQINALDELEFTYDISLVYNRKHIDDDDPWPFTLDYGWPFTCHAKCPIASHKGFWQVPINSMWDYKHESTCAFVDGCNNRPYNEADAYKFIMDNFYSHYNGNRSPFGFNMHSGWFVYGYTRDAMERAIRDMLQHDGVYIVSVKHILEWMRNPTKIADIKKFDGLGCWTKPTRSRARQKEVTQTILVIFQLVCVLCAVIGTSVYNVRKLLKRRKVNKYDNMDGNIEERVTLINAISTIGW